MQELLLGCDEMRIWSTLYSVYEWEYTAPDSKVIITQFGENVKQSTPWVSISILIIYISAFLKFFLGTESTATYSY